MYKNINSKSIWCKQFAKVIVWLYNMLFVRNTEIKIQALDSGIAIKEFGIYI